MVSKSSSDSTDDDLLTTAQAAHVLHISPRTLERMRREHRGPPYRTHGRYIFYVRGEIKAWSRAQTHHPSASGRLKEDSDRQLSLPLPMPKSPSAHVVPTPPMKPTLPTQGSA